MVCGVDYEYSRCACLWDISFFGGEVLCTVWWRAVGIFFYMAFELLLWYTWEKFSSVFVLCAECVAWQFPSEGIAIGPYFVSSCV